MSRRSHESDSEMEETKQRPHILMSAYACSPYRGSEPSVGWNRAYETAKYCDVTVLTEDRESAPDVERFLAENGPIPGLRFVYVPTQKWERWVGAWRVPAYLMLNLWQRRAYRTAYRLNLERRFDLVHHVTFCGYREPGYLWKLNAPFVWGPVGGSQNFPIRFLKEAGFRGGVSELARSVVNGMQLRLSPRVRQVVKRSRVILAANSTNQRDLARIHGVSPILMLETGVPEEQLIPAQITSHPGRLRVLWAGLHHPGKGLPLLLRALAQLPVSVKYELRILGAGPATGAWQRLAQDLGVDGYITWLGWIGDQSRVREQQRWADVFAFTSLRDTSGNVMLESLAACVPVICLDHQGAHDIVTDECGIQISVESPTAAIREISAALQRLYADDALLTRLKMGAGRRARSLAWSSLGRRMIDEVYRPVLGEAFLWPEKSAMCCV